MIGGQFLFVILQDCMTPFHLGLIFHMWLMLDISWKNVMQWIINPEMSSYTDRKSPDLSLFVRA